MIVELAKEMRGAFAAGARRWAAMPWAMTGRRWAALFGAARDGAINFDAFSRMGVHAGAKAAGKKEPEAKAPETLQDWRDAFAWLIPQRAPTMIDAETGIAVMDIRGPLVSGETPVWVAWMGATTYEELGAEALALAKDERVKGVLLTVDSPGGMCSGCVEASKKLAGLAIDKPMVAHCTGLGCSAAYSLMVGASRIVADPSADVGSIGTILPMLDVSGAWEQMGVAEDYITNDEADLKAAGYPPNQTEAERASLQELVNDLAAQFRGHVLDHRALDPGTMRGQSMIAPRALAANLIDQVGSRADAVAWLRMSIS